MTGSANRRIVVVSYFHPPFPSAGGTRWDSLSHYLRELGYSVTIVACDAWGVLPTDAALGVKRISDLRSIGVLRRLLRRGKLQRVGDANVLERPPTAVLTEVVVPDLHLLSWLPAVMLFLHRLVRTEHIDCLVTSSPPASSHLAGLLLGSRRPPWIADFRDGWRFQDGREPFPTSAQRRLDAWLERRVADNADVAVGATTPIATDLEQRLDARAACVPNAWDPRLSPLPGSHSSVPSSPGMITLVLTGTLSGVRGSDPRPLLNALRAARAGPDPIRVRLLHAGRLTTEERALIDGSGVADLVQHVGTVPRHEALVLQRSADALVLLTSRNSSEASSKTFEYLAAGRPILALAEGNEAARIIRETNTGVTVAPDDVNAIEIALRQVASGELERVYAPRGLERFTYPGPAESMAKLIEDAIQRREDHSRAGSEVRGLGDHNP